MAWLVDWFKIIKRWIESVFPTKVAYEIKRFKHLTEDEALTLQYIQAFVKFHDENGYMPSDAELTAYADKLLMRPINSSLQ